MNTTNLSSGQPRPNASHLDNSQGEPLVLQMQVVERPPDLTLNIFGFRVVCEDCRITSLSVYPQLEDAMRAVEEAKPTHAKRSHRFLIERLARTPQGDIFSQQVNGRWVFVEHLGNEQWVRIEQAPGFTPR